MSVFGDLAPSAASVAALVAALVAASEGVSEAAFRSTPRPKPEKAWFVWFAEFDWARAVPQQRVRIVIIEKKSAVAKMTELFLKVTSRVRYGFI
jgi:hypothetical protein